MLKQTVVRLPVDLLKEAKLTAVQEDTTLQQVITKALDAYLHQGKGGQR